MSFGFIRVSYECLTSLCFMQVLINTPETCILYCTDVGTHIVHHRSYSAPCNFHLNHCLPNLVSVCNCLPNLVSVFNCLPNLVSMYNCLPNLVSVNHCLPNPDSVYNCNSAL